MAESIPFHVAMRALLIMGIFVFGGFGVYGDDRIERACANEAPAEVSAAPRQETVVLLHGMGRSRASMWPLAKRLRLAGYRTLNFPYVPRKHTVRELSDQLHGFVAQKVETETYHFVGHSLGNIIVREGFYRSYRDGLGRIVMLAPPNHPPELADRLRGNWLYRFANGKAGQELGSEAFYTALPVPTVPFGIVAGEQGHRLVFDEANDGIVTVEGTRLEGMADWARIRKAHTFIMNGGRVAALCIRFLREGRFREQME